MRAPLEPAAARKRVSPSTGRPNVLLSQLELYYLMARKKRVIKRATDCRYKTPAIQRISRRVDGLNHGLRGP